MKVVEGNFKAEGKAKRPLKEVLMDALEESELADLTSTEFFMVVRTEEGFSLITDVRQVSDSIGLLETAKFIVQMGHLVE
jgi:hypothetical protein